VGRGSRASRRASLAVIGLASASLWIAVWAVFEAITG
jgi:hypothetical protein